MDIELETVFGLENDSETPILRALIFKAGEVVEDVQVIDVNENYRTVTIQFSDGTCAFGVLRGMFEILD